MANSLSTITGPEPTGSFEHSLSHTRFTIQNELSGLRQTLERDGQSESLLVQYRVGSGAHAYGYLAKVGDHLFQSPLSFYSSSGRWDVAPGYENDRAPDFTRPVTPECVACHSGEARPVPNTLNSYASPPFAASGITCERCHGNSEAHLANPVPGSILNPAKLPESARDSICEQCHLSGEIRIPNPGKRLTDFHPGQALEATYTVYVAGAKPDDTVKVISQAEQFALSTCKRRSGAKMWCGTCHDPHEQPAEPVSYFRQRCLSCHQTSLEPKHAALTGCISCHMVRRPAKDGGHTAFTDHRISRYPSPGASAISSEIHAWREPPPEVRERNLALALVTTGFENNSSDQMIRGYKMLNRLDKTAANDPEVQTALGSILLKAKESAAAVTCFTRALSLRQNYAPYEVNLGTALLSDNLTAEAVRHFEKALELDPLLRNGVYLLASAYRSLGENAKADLVISKYRKAMGFSALSPRLEPMGNN